MKLKLLSICLFISGGGTKLIQSQIGNSDQIMTLPSYPLLYFTLTGKTGLRNIEKCL